MYLCVPSSAYPTIQNAVENVTEGQVIVLEGGEYHRQVSLDRDIGSFKNPILIIPQENQNVTFITNQSSPVFVVKSGNWKIHKGNNEGEENSEDDNTTTNYGTLNFVVSQDISIVKITDFLGVFYFSDFLITVNVDVSNYLFFVNYDCDVNKIVFSNLEIVTDGSTYYRGFNVDIEKKCMIPSESLIIEKSKFNQVQKRLINCEWAYNIHFRKNYIIAYSYTESLFYFSSYATNFMIENNILILSNSEDYFLEQDCDGYVCYIESIYIQNNLFVGSNPNSPLFLSQDSTLGDFNLIFFVFQNNLFAGDVASDQIWKAKDSNIGNYCNYCLFRYNYLENDITISYSDYIDFDLYNTITTIPFYSQGKKPAPYYKSHYLSSNGFTGKVYYGYSPSDDYEGNEFETFLAGPFQTVLCMNQYFDEYAQCFDCKYNRNVSQDCLQCKSGYNFENECNTCLGNRDIEKECKECLNHFYDENNDCGSCPSEFDSSDCLSCSHPNKEKSTNCTTCKEFYDPNKDCDFCLIENKDENNNCLLCKNMWRGENCLECPGNIDPNTNCSDCLFPWDNTQLLCSQCLSGWSLDSNCTECEDGFDISNNCEVCIENYDLEQNCRVCINNYNILSNCEECLGGFTLESNCKECINSNYDETTNCLHCKNKWSKEENCLKCLSNFDESTNCTQCKEGYTGSNCDTITCFDISEGSDSCNRVGECVDIDYCYCYSDQTRLFGRECNEKIEKESDFYETENQIIIYYSISKKILENEFDGINIDCLRIFPELNLTNCQMNCSFYFRDEEETVSSSLNLYFDCEESNFRDRQTITIQPLTRQQNQVEQNNISIVLNKIITEQSSSNVGAILGGIFGVLSVVIIFFFVISLVIFIVIIYNEVKRRRVKKLLDEVGEEELDIVKQERSIEVPIKSDLSLKRNLFSIDFSELEILEQIGEGGSRALIFRCKWTQNSTIVAFKLFKISVFSEEKEIERFQREVSIALNIQHPSILRTFGCVSKKPRLGIVMEYCSNGSLSDYINDMNDEIAVCKKIIPKEKIRMLFELTSALNYLHNKDIIHRDVKPENILLNDVLKVKLIDFGVSKVLDKKKNSQQTSRVGTSYYMAPEIFKGESYDSQVDIFSFGITCYALFYETNEPYGEHSTNIEVRVATDPSFRPNFNAKGKEQVQQFGGLKDFISKCWVDSTKDRPKTNEVMIFFQNLYEESSKVKFINKI